MKIHTIQASRRRRTALHVVNISDKTETGRSWKMIPDWEMISAYMDGRMSEEEYHEKYIEVLDKNEATLLKYFKDLAALPGYEKLALACDCTPGHFCQRVLLAQWLSDKLGWDYAGEIK